MSVMSLREEVEHWVPMRRFRTYEISNLGRIANRRTDVVISPSTTMQGDLKVNLYQDLGRKNTRPFTRSVKVLVAEHFVPLPEQVGPHAFDTPIQLDGDQLNCRASNLMWRPRWFAINWKLELDRIRNDPEHWDFYNNGPIVEIDRHGIICAAYHNILEVATKNGYLPSTIWKSINTGSTVFPDMKVYEFHHGV